jgi:succinate dehydrogenase/fumarate reductase flavoprotein subunit
VEYDVVVVGSGAGALVGAWSAATKGLRVAVLEKAPVCGGTSAYSGGGMFLPGNHLTVGAGLPDSVQRARTYVGGLVGEVDDRLEAFLSSGPGLVEELTKDPLLALERTPFPEYYDSPGRLAEGGQLQPVLLSAADVDPDVLALVRPAIAADRWFPDAPRDPLWGGQSLIARLLMSLKRTGNADVHVEHSVDELVVEDGRVVGVRAETPNGRVEVRARLGVLLAAGGFERNAELRAKHGVPGEAQNTQAPVGTNLGEPLLAAIAIGADTALLNEAWFCGALVEPDGTAGFILGPSGGLAVDASGRRFANESLPYDRFGREMAAHAPTAWFVFDARFKGRIPLIRCVSGPRREEYLASGAWVLADTLASLAEAIGTPALEESVARFNEFARNGVDEDFHRGEDEFDRYWARGDGPNSALVPLEEGPYIAAKLVLGDLGTKGGLMTDPDANVLRPDGSPIPGLYAAGNTMAAVTRAYYPAPGTPIGTAMVFAHRAVQSMLRT